MMRALIDREVEAARLEEAAGRAPQLVVLRGRRRVGKSFLIDRGLRGHRQVSFQADEQDERGHLDLLSREAARLLPGAPPLRFDDWDSAFAYFGNQAEQEPLVIVLDEFQWMWSAQPALDSIIQRHWDRWQREAIRTTLILSGSALTLMERLLDHGSPLFGRADYRPLIAPLDYRYASEFADPTQGGEENLRRYAVLGGTPQYQVWAGGGPALQVIRDRILAKGESLYEEPLHLLREEQQIRDYGTYFSIIAAIANGATRFNEIGQQAHVARNLDTMLGRLEELAYIEKRRPVELKPSEKRTSYRICDPFFRFWFRYVFPNRSRLERGRVDEVLTEIEADLDNFMGLAFEDCCREFVDRYATTDWLPSCEVLGAWWSRKGDVEIDIAGMNDGRYVLLGSCKWSKSMSIHELDELIGDRNHLGDRAAQAQLALFARGFTDELIERAGREGADLFTAEDLFSA